jgi:photosystem II stability/assembly factor-like uncharacterized protein
MTTTVLAGTQKGAFLFRSSSARSDWTIEGPLFKGWKVTAAARLPDGTFLAATASDVYGPALHRSRDLREWRQIEKGPAWPEGSTRKLNQIWKIAAGHGRVFAGVDEAGLFASADGGTTWTPVTGLNEHPTRAAWFPGAGGLCAHAVLFDPNDRNRMWCGISAVGVFRSDDGGATWQPKNSGVRMIIEDQAHKEIGFCVHGLAQDPRDADTIYRQDHAGMYVTRNGGDTWEAAENGLPSGFGFPIAVDRTSGRVYAAPLESDEHRMPVDGALRVFRSGDGAASWQALAAGLPQTRAYMGVLRGALDVDALDPCGVYFGTTAGTVHFSADGGDSWRTLPCTLPRVLSVSAFVEQG